MKRLNNYWKCVVVALLLVWSCGTTRGQQTDSSFQGNFYSIVVSGTTLFAATGSHGVYRSSDKGEKWIRVDKGLSSQKIFALVMSGTTLFAGGDKGIHRSSDNGETWTTVNTGQSNITVFNFAVSDAMLFAGTDVGVLRSTDKGDNWVNAGLANEYISTLGVSGTALFAGTVAGSGIYRSGDNGRTWKSVNIGLMNPIICAFTVIDTMLFVGTTNGVYRSSNNGETWTEVNTGLTDKVVASFFVIGTTLYAGTSSGAYLSSNNGQTWALVDENLTNYKIQFLAVSSTTLPAETSDNKRQNNPNPTDGVELQKISRLNQTLQSSAPPRIQWTRKTQQKNMLNKQIFYDSHNIAIEGTTIYLSYTEEGTNFTQVACWKIGGGKPTIWVGPLRSKNYYEIICTAVIGSSVFVSIIRDGLFRSDDEGKTWKKVLDFGPLSIATSDKQAIYVSTIGRVLQSFDKGNTWTNMSNGSPQNYTLELLTNEQDLFGYSTAEGIMYKRINGRWEIISSDLPNNDLVVKSFFSVGSRLFICLSKSIWVSNNGGQQWKPLKYNTDSEGDHFYSLTQLDDVLILAASGGIYSSFDIGDHWQYLGEGSRFGSELKSLKRLFTADNQKLYALCSDGEVYETDKASILSAAKGSANAFRKNAFDNTVPAVSPLPTEKSIAAIQDSIAREINRMKDSVLNAFAKQAKQREDSITQASQQREDSLAARHKRLLESIRQNVLAASIKQIRGVLADSTTLDDPTLEVEEFQSQKHIPLLPVFFFTENSSVIPSKYRRIQAPDRLKYQKKNLDTLSYADIYYEMLNILGRRMSENSKSNIKCIGYVAKRETNQDLGKQRAESIKNYLTDIWKINAKRISIESKTEEFITSTVLQGQNSDLNMCVEIQSDTPQFLEDIHASYIFRKPKLKSIVLDIDVQAGAGLKQWSCEIHQIVKDEDTTIQSFSGEIKAPQSLVWNIEESSQSELPQSDEPLNVELGGFDVKNRAIDKAIRQIPVKRISVDSKKAARLNDERIETYKIYVLPTVQYMNIFLPQFVMKLKNQLSSSSKMRLTCYCAESDRLKENSSHCQQQMQELLDKLNFSVTQSVLWKHYPEEKIQSPELGVLGNFIQIDVFNGVKW